MKLLAPLTIVVAVMFAALSIPSTESAAAVCPDLSIGSGCHTGGCGNSKLHPNVHWNIPTGVPLLVGYGTAAFYLEGSIPDDTNLGNDIMVTQRKNFTTCCHKCKKAKYTCTYYQFLNLGSFGGLCFVYTGQKPPHCNSSILVKTRAGAKCQVGIQNDPHLVGAQGTRFDFSGRPGKSYCLLSDSRLHLNMKMVGYLDNRTESATVLSGGRAVRTWIRELGVMWKVDAWESHSLRLVARSGSSAERGDGFLSFMQYDEDEILPSMAVGSVLTRAQGALTVTFVAVERKGPYEVEYYRVQVGELLDMDVRLRVAHPLLRTPTDAQAHISLGFNHVQSTPLIHGVLGQTYRDGRESRGVEFQKLAALLHRNVGADSEEGRGFLDGEAADYVASDVMTPDCRYSAYQGWATDLVKRSR